MPADAAILAAASSAPQIYTLSVAELFTVFFIMLGPIKAIGPFFVGTRHLEPSALRMLSLRIFVLALITLIAGGIVGDFLLTKWRISAPVLQIAAGLIFLLTALQTVLAQYKPAPAAAHDPGDQPDTMHLLFPVTVTPYGMAAVILLLASSTDAARSGIVLALVSVVMVLNLLAMLFVRGLMRSIGIVPLQILGAVLGVLQVALAIAIMVGGLHKIGLPIAPEAGTTPAVQVAPGVLP